MCCAGMQVHDVMYNYSCWCYSVLATQGQHVQQPDLHVQQCFLMDLAVHRYPMYCGRLLGNTFWFELKPRAVKMVQNLHQWCRSPLAVA